MFGKILDADDGVLGDLKVTSSFKLMKALGIYKAKVDTGEVYKSGAKKGLPKFRTELRFDGVRDLLDWAIQLNYYRMLLEPPNVESPSPSTSFRLTKSATIGSIATFNTKPSY